MNSVAVLVPWMDTGCEWRRRALSFSVWWWKMRHPDWEVIVGEQTSGVWSKGEAVAAGLARTRADVLVIPDADSLVSNAADAVRRIERGAPWVVPHGAVYRLNEKATREVLASGELRLGPLARSTYQGCRGGGVVVIPREGYIGVGGFDPRFRGHGWEDECFGWAADLLLGEATRLRAPLVHLWHPPAAPGGRARERGVIDQYRHARRERSAMRAVVAPNAATLRGDGGGGSEAGGSQMGHGLTVESG